jgi:hypothetical protein
MDSRAQNELRGFRQAPHRAGGSSGFAFGAVVEVDKHRTAAGCFAGLDIACPVPDHEAGIQTDIELPGGGEDEPWLRLAAGALRLTRVRAHLDEVDGQLAHEGAMHLCDRFWFDQTHTHVGLVCNDDEEKSPEF